jgi:carbonic anhydrase
MLLSHLFDRNVAWAHRKTRSDPTFFARLAEQQSPRYLWIGCSDSRVAANDILDLDPGEVFVHRNVANMVHTSDMNLLAVMEYAVLTLRVEHIIVCGHYGCGGVQRALCDHRSALVDHWLQPLVMMYQKHRAVFDGLSKQTSRLDRVCELNVEMQVRRVAATPIVEAAWRQRQSLHIHGWIYGIHDGLLRDLGTSIASFEQRNALPSIDRRALEPTEPLSGIRLHALETFADLNPDPLTCDHSG